ncbi:hypothetical protein [Trinickia terrae]|uniref:hypothetical protein n=1 Tax=Trinickia terrae TaxID=2571161 RepID=UPI00146AEE4C|nr:hypothetical protein [Trinickia terrae]
MSKQRDFSPVRWIVRQALTFAMVVLCAVVLGVVLGTLVAQLINSFPAPFGMD